MEQKNSSKDSMSNLFNRYIWLVDIIYRTEYISFEEINERWCRSQLNINCEELPLRTFHNHRKAIEQMFDVNIECDKRNGYKYYIENPEDIERGGVRSWLLNTIAVNNLINESHKFKHRILFEQIPSGEKYLTTIIEAIRDNLSLKITYQSFGANAPFTFEVNPYCVKIFRQRWYLVAYNSFKQDIFIYALDRIKNLITTHNTFEFPQNFDCKAFFAESFGIEISNSMKAELIRIKIKGITTKGAPKYNYTKSLPLHHSQKEEEVGDDYAIYSYYLKPTYDFLIEILSRGAEFEVLEPASLRQRVADVIKEQYNMYHAKA